jgi:hypothetical protein
MNYQLVQPMKHKSQKIGEILERLPKEDKIEVKNAIAR